ncbi:PPOX class F420-dependent oxidoreductase [Amycolatopsis rubida]|uniref:Pyridoxamine 5'-phosphate oxidase N-terminal domain-containing protein n=1 Tax=Amycolatopsis rubida TaxID=112413 RepID=A0A1I5ZHF2_9PSEU|nr:PPOX class F420-dependent oxidoreductase [Amycolatopsis rubida]SFQ55892.1 hypothetical protein SAMN05421854_11584 [Amycolatopsis rubida]
MPGKVIDNQWWQSFVLAAPRTGKLAVTRKDGSPHVTPVWVDLDGGTVVFTARADSVKGRAMLREGRIAICFDDDRPPFAFVLITGDAEIDDHAGNVRRWMHRIAARYLGEERAQEWVDRVCVPGEVVVRVTDATVIGQAGVVDSLLASPPPALEKPAVP